MSAAWRGSASRTLGLLRRNWLLLLGLAALSGLVIAVGPGRLGAALAHADRRVLVAMLPCVLAVYVLRALAWRVTLGRLGLNLSRRRTIRIMVAGQALIFLPGGDLWRVPVFVRAEEVRDRGGELAASIVFEDLVFLALFSLAPLPLLAQAPAFTPVLLAALLGQALVWVLLSWPRAYSVAVRAATVVRPLARVSTQLGQLGPTFRHLARGEVLVRVVPADAVAVTLSFVLFALALRALHVTSVAFVKAAFVLALGQMVAGLSMLPAGLGANEAALTGLLVLTGVSPATGAAAALLYRGFSDVLMAALGLVSGLGLRRRPASPPEDGGEG
ncbi:MAG TPA: lysylphosphatidylglycerol synthase transmembrane domain-containing protein [Candidatus Dormibacteraeota bacterium]|nr:lysylphosphatidylglycerol synthase transmembrane domain-containing protein [Candidatus Dormibacteraeota bacterium]